MHSQAYVQIASAALLALLVGGCTPADTDSAVSATGTVLSSDVRLAAPALPAPLPRVTSALEEQPVQSGSATGGAGPSPVAYVTGVGSRSRVESAPVTAGDRVRAGDVVAILDARVLAGAVGAAKADAERARASSDLLDERLGDVSEKRGDLHETRAEVASRIRQLESTRASLAARLSDAKAALAAIEAMSQGRPGMPPTGSVPPTSVPPSSVPTGSVPPGSGLPDVATLKQGIASLQAGLRALDAGLGRARAGLARLDEAGATAADARRTLEGMRPVARGAARLARSGIAVAEAQLSLATVRTPVDGTVFAAPRAGDVVAPGAPLVIVRPDGRARVRTWLPVDALHRLAPGDPAVVTLDSMPETRLKATVTRIGETAEFPPTSLSTRELHLIRAALVEVTLDTTVPLPPGTPADLTIHPR